MKNTIAQLMGRDKYIIAAVHFLPLPGSPNYDSQGGMKAIIQRAKRDAKILADNGVQSFLFTNEADMPYMSTLPQEGVTAFTVLVQEVMQDYDIPFGINCLIDAYAGFCIAHATGASFIRGLFSGAYVIDSGIMEAQGARIFRTRAGLNVAKPYLFHNLSSILGPLVVEKPADVEAKSMIAHVKVDGFTLPANNHEMFKKISEIAPDRPLVVGSGTHIDNLQSLMEVSDGAIVATCLREDGKLLAPVDAKRTTEFMQRFNQLAVNA